jgi:hypothetical protein
MMDRLPVSSFSSPSPQSQSFNGSNNDSPYPSATLTFKQLTGGFKAGGDGGALPSGKRKRGGSLENGGDDGKLYCAQYAVSYFLANGQNM